MSDETHGFRIRPGHMRDVGARSGGSPKLFVDEVMRVGGRATYPDHGFATSSAGPSPRSGGGRAAAAAVGLRSPSRRVIVKFLVAPHTGPRPIGPLRSQVAYLKRDGVDRTGGEGRLFDARGKADERAFVARCGGDGHHFRFMISPQDGAELQDLRATTGDLMRLAERDLGARLDWIAVEHWNTAHPHVHVLVRGADQDGVELVISRDYLHRGLRARAEALVSLELGPRSAREIAADLQRQVVAERWTRLDRVLEAHAVGGLADLRRGPDAPDPDLRPLLIGRARTLERLGLANEESPEVWRLDAYAEQRLGDLLDRGDIVQTVHRAVGEDRTVAEPPAMGEAARGPVTGRLVERGLFDELSGSAYLVVDGVDGRAHHVRFADLEAAGDTPIGGIVEVRPGDLDSQSPRLVHCSDLSLDQQVTAQGATWLDRQLVARDRLGLSDNGFGAQVREAMHLRGKHLVGEGHATIRDGRLTVAQGLIAQLEAKELAAAGERLARATGLAFQAQADDPWVRGRYVRRLDLASRRYAVVEDERGFRLVPWASALKHRLGREVTGQLRDGAMAWDLERTRGLSR